MFLDLVEDEVWPNLLDSTFSNLIIIIILYLQQQLRCLQLRYYNITLGMEMSHWHMLIGTDGHL